jgi:hypothetical protein
MTHRDAVLDEAMVQGAVEVSRLAGDQDIAPLEEIAAAINKVVCGESGNGWEARCLQGLLGVAVRE